MTTFVKISVTNISVYREISFKSEKDRRLRASAIGDYTTTTPTNKNIKFFFYMHSRGLTDCQFTPIRLKYGLLRFLPKTMLLLKCL